MTFQVIVGSSDLKANQSIIQVVEILTDMEKYNRYVIITGVSKRLMLCFTDLTQNVMFMQAD